MGNPETQAPLGPSHRIEDAQNKKNTHTHTENQNDEQCESYQNPGDETRFSRRINSSCFLRHSPCTSYDECYM